MRTAVGATIVALVTQVVVLTFAYGTYLVLGTVPALVVIGFLGLLAPWYTVTEWQYVRRMARIERESAWIAYADSEEDE